MHHQLKMTKMEVFLSKSVFSLVLHIYLQMANRGEEKESRTFRGKLLGTFLVKK